MPAIAGNPRSFEGEEEGDDYQDRRRGNVFSEIGKGISVLAIIDSILYTPVLTT